MVIIPNFDFNSYVETIVLDGVPYEFGFRWNTRDESWSMSIAREGVTLLASIKVVSAFELISRYKNISLPDGFIYTLDLQNLKRNPNREELGTVIKLGFATTQEVENDATI